MFRNSSHLERCSLIQGNTIFDEVYGINPYGRIISPHHERLILGIPQTDERGKALELAVKENPHIHTGLVLQSMVGRFIDPTHVPRRIISSGVSNGLGENSVVHTIEDNVASHAVRVGAITSDVVGPIPDINDMTGMDPVTLRMWVMSGALIHDLPEALSVHSKGLQADVVALKKEDEPVGEAVAAEEMTMAEVIREREILLRTLIDERICEVIERQGYKPSILLTEEQMDFYKRFELASNVLRCGLVESNGGAQVSSIDLRTHTLNLIATTAKCVDNIEAVMLYHTYLKTFADLIQKRQAELVQLPSLESRMFGFNQVRRVLGLADALINSRTHDAETSHVNNSVGKALAKLGAETLWSIYREFNSYAQEEEYRRLMIRIEKKQKPLGDNQRDLVRLFLDMDVQSLAYSHPEMVMREVLGLGGSYNSSASSRERKVV